MTAGYASATEEPWPPAWMVDLEQAHAALLRALGTLEAFTAAPVVGGAPFDLAEIGDRIVRALGHLYDAIDEREERHKSASQAYTEALDGRDRLATTDDADLRDVHAALAAAATALQSAERRLTSVIDVPRPPPAPIRASRETPALHVVPRPSLVPTPRLVGLPPVAPPLPPALPEPKTLADLAAMAEKIKKQAEEMEAAAAAKRAAFGAKKEEPPKKEAPSGFVRELPERQKPGAFLAARARDCLEEIAMIGMQRLPLLGDPFRSVAFLERRMLTSLDAVASLGPVGVARIEPQLLDAPVRDAARAQAGAFALGCLEGRDALGALERVAHAYGWTEDPAVAAGIADGLKLATNPLLSVVLRAWLAHPAPLVRATAIDVLGYRGLASADELLRCAADVPVVAEKALPPLGLLYPRDREREIQAVLDTALASESVPLQEAAWHAMMLLGHPHVAHALHRAAGEKATESRAVIPLAVVSDLEDARHLFATAQKAPTELLVLAVGWAGLAESVPWLITMVAGKKKELKVAAANALDRITGAQLYEEIELAPEKLDVEDPPEPEIDLGGPKPPSLARKVSDPRDLPGEGAPDAMELPTTDAERWREYWAEHRERYHAGTRFRRGHPYTPRVTLWELDGWRVTPFERRMLHREMVVRTGAAVRFDPFDLVAVQEAALRQMEAPASSASSYPGGWHRVARKA